MAPDLHHSQFYTSPLNLNPALTGVFNGDYRFAMNYRSQWFINELVQYQTMSANADMKFFPKKDDAKGFWSAGLLFNYDQAGDSRLSLAHLGLSGAYTRALNSRNLVSLGGLVGFGQRRFRTDDLVWDEQWINGQLVPDAPSMEDFSNTSNGFLDLSLGLNYRWQKNERTNINIGLGAFHLNEPDQTFFDQSSTEALTKRLAFSALASFKIINEVDLLIHGLYQSQYPYEEIVFGGYGKIYINKKRGKEFALLLGAAVRLDDAFIPKIAVEYNNWYGGFSYDVNNSKFKSETNRRGGPEFSLIYRITTVKPLPKFKNCPIF
jgi:type IX secretion system PorP/SprF family membrane protein